MRDDRDNKDDMEENHHFQPESHATILPLLDAYSTGELTETEQRMVKQHIVSCKECQRFLADIHTFRCLLQLATTQPLLMSEGSIPASNNTSLANTVMAELAQSMHPTKTNEWQVETTATKGTAMHQTTKSPADDHSADADSSMIRGVSSETQIPAHSITARRKKPEGQHPSRVRYLVNTIAAVLVVGIIIGASVLLFTHHPAAPATGGQPKQAIPSSDFCHLDVDPGLRYVCQNHLYQNIYQSKQMGKYTITIQQAYADAARIAFSYTITKGKQDLTMDVAPHPVNVTFNHGYNNNFPHEAASLVNGGTAAALSFYGGPSILKQKTIALQVNIGGLLSYSKPDKVNGTLTFSFTLHVHTEVRTFTLHQSTTENGIPMSLKGGGMSLSYVQFELSYSRPANSKVFPGPVTLSSGTTTCFGIVTNNNQLTMDPNTPQAVAIPCPIFTAQGQWTLTIHALGVGSSNGNSQLPSWVFHFTFPSA